MRFKSDVLVIGSGIAGLTFAIKLAILKPDCKISVLAKGDLDESSTNFAQGGIATVTDLSNDSFQAHIEDTLKSGDGLSIPAIVRLVVESGPERIKDLVEFGVDFTKRKDGAFDLALEGGHSTNRIVHTFDNTGFQVQKALLQKAFTFKNISFFKNRFCFELLASKSGEICGVNTLNTETKKVTHFKSKVVVLATGGSGQVYHYTTNPSVATGDGISMAKKISVMISNLNYVQFHPTALYEEDKIRLDLLTEAIRGFGGYVVNREGIRFLYNTDVRGELATRDIVSKAIFEELNRSGEKCVYLDCRHLDRQEFERRFPQISANISKRNLDVSQDLIPIIPAAHYQCGGITVNEKGQTNKEGLYAIGECADTGLHGANRLASNSLLEGLVFGHEVAEWISFIIDEMKDLTPEKQAKYALDTSDDELYKNVIIEIKNVMSQHATIASNLTDFEIAMEKLDDLQVLMASQDQPCRISEYKITATNLLVNAKEIVKNKRREAENKHAKSKMENV